MRLQILACWHETRLEEAEVIAGNKLDYDNKPSHSKVVERSTHNLTFKGSNLAAACTGGKKIRKYGCNSRV
jgi:hypothetical protein